MSSYTHDTLQLKFNGRIIDHLGIQMYQSATAALAEFIANSWDANAENVWITLPNSLLSGKITIKDDGIGMTFAECESRYHVTCAGQRKRTNRAGSDPRPESPRFDRLAAAPTFVRKT